MGILIDVIAVRLFLRLLLGGILLSGGVGKLADWHSFRSGIQHYRVIPSLLESKMAFSTILSFCIPCLEIGVSLGLVSGLLIVPATMLALILLIVLSGAILLNLRRSRRDLSCHCGGVLGSHPLSWWLLGRNSCILASLMLLLLTPADPLTLDRVVRDSSVLSVLLWNTVLPVIILVSIVLIALLLVNATQHLLHSSLSSHHQGGRAV